MLWRSILALGALVAVSAQPTGQELCNNNMCIKALRENGIDTFTLKPVHDIALDKFGWAAMGFGGLMPHSPMVIMWPNHDGSFTLSQREASGHVMPEVVANPARVATLNIDNSYSNDTTTALSYSIPSDAQNMTMIIWALSRENPGTPNPNAILTQHTWMGVMWLYMDAPYDSGSVFEWDGHGIPDHSKTMKQNGSPAFVLIAHIVCGVLAVMLVLPGGVVVPRITRGLTTSRWWFHFHIVNQGITAVALVCAAFGIGLTFGGELDSRHRKTGVALFALVMLQTLLGAFSHWYTPGWRMQKFTFVTKRGRGPSNFVHAALGVVCVAVGWSAAWTGLTDEWHKRGHGVPAFGWRVGWGVIIMIWIVAYIIGLVFFLPRQLRIESREREIQRQEENYKVFRGSTVALANDYYMERRKAEEEAAAVAEATRGSYPFHNANGSGNGPGFYSQGGDSKIYFAPNGSSMTVHTTYSNRDSLPPLSPPRTHRAFPSQSTATFTSDYLHSPRSMDFSPPSKYTATFAPTGPPLPPSPSKPEGLDGEAFAIREAECEDDNDHTPIPRPKIEDCKPTRIPSPKLPWAGQLHVHNPLKKGAKGGMI